jgi:tRNA(Ile)-lysidine synthase
MLDRLTIEQMTAKAGETPILVALSGGGDSVALMIMLLDALRGHDVRAVIVDHKLRKSSGEDAARACDIASSWGCTAYIEELEWAEGANRAHEAARRARYVALCGAARKCGAKVIVTGHTRDDQAETVLLRVERGSGLRGLAGMRAWSPMPIWPEGRGFWLARPLLNVRRLELRHQLLARGAMGWAPGWIEDPANVDRTYARVRVRQHLEALEEDHGFNVMRLAAVAERLAPHMAALDEAAYALIESAAAFDGDTITVDSSRFVGTDEAVRQRAAQALITAAGGHARGAPADDVAKCDEAMRSGAFTAATLAGALVRKRGGAIVLCRDRGALGGRADGTPGVAPLHLPAGRETVWDARLALTAPDEDWSVIVENGAPWLARGEERAALAVGSPHWLLRERVRHVLGRD